MDTSTTPAIPTNPRTTYPLRIREMSPPQIRTIPRERMSMVNQKIRWLCQMNRLMPILLSGASSRPSLETCRLDRQVNAPKTCLPMQTMSLLPLLLPKLPRNHKTRNGLTKRPPKKTIFLNRLVYPSTLPSPRLKLRKAPRAPLQQRSHLLHQLSEMIRTNLLQNRLTPSLHSAEVHPQDP